MLRFAFSTSLLFTLTLALGCGGGSQPAPTSKPNSTVGASTPAKDGHDHAGHGAGPHEGSLADWGGGKFHVEFTVDHDKQEATVYILGSDEKTATPIKAKDDEVLLSIQAPAFQVTLHAVPLEGEAEGTASRFVGKHESLAVVQEFAGTISAEVDGTPFAGEFKEEPHDTHSDK